MAKRASWRPHGDNGTWRTRYGDFELWALKWDIGWSWEIYRIRVGEPRFVAESGEDGTKYRYATRDLAQRGALRKARTLTTETSPC